MLAWRPHTDSEIQQIRFRRHIEHLERRIKALRSAQLRFFYRDQISELERELAVLRGQAGGV